MNIKEFLEEKAAEFETRDFIPDDPISIPHLFTDKKDVSSEIARLFSCNNSLGQ